MKKAEKEEGNRSPFERFSLSNLQSKVLFVFVSLDFSSNQEIPQNCDKFGNHHCVFDRRSSFCNHLLFCEEMSQVHFEFTISVLLYSLVSFKCSS